MGRDAAWDVLKQVEEQAACSQPVLVLQVMQRLAEPLVVTAGRAESAV